MRILASTSVPFRPTTVQNDKFSNYRDETDYCVSIRILRPSNGAVPSRWCEGKLCLYCWEQDLYPPTFLPSSYVRQCTNSANAFVFCRLYHFYPQPPRQCLGPIFLSALSLHCIAGAVLPNHMMMGEVSWDPKRRRSWAS
jgi:hypothetical protein